MLVTDLHATVGAWGRGGVRGAGAPRGHPRPAAALLLVRAARHTGGFSHNAYALNSMMGDFFLVFH